MYIHVYMCIYVVSNIDDNEFRVPDTIKSGCINVSLSHTHS